MALEEYRSSPDVRTGVVQGNTFSNRRVQYSVIDGQAIFEGDIVLGTVEEMEQLAADVIPQAVIISGARFRWPGGVVPFTIDPALPDVVRVNDAIAHWHNRTHIRLVTRTTEQNFVTFRPGTECSSQVGMRGGEQFITLAPGCNRGEVIHEIGHTVGLWHEQSREDRDQFVRIHWENIQLGQEHNFNQHITDGDDLGPYDFGSIMHYSAFAFSRNGRPTIETLHGEAIGQRNGLSDGDVQAVDFRPNLLLNDGQVLRWLGTAHQWEQIGNASIASMAAAGSALYLLLNDGQVLRWLGTAHRWEQIGNASIASMAAAGSALYLLLNDGQVLRWLGTAHRWEQIGNASIASMAAAGSALYLLLNNGEVLRWLGTAHRWEQIGNNVTIASMAAAGSALYLLLNDGQVLRWLGTAHKWDQIGNASIASMAVAESALYLLLNNGEVLRWLGTAHKWDQIGNASIASMAAAGSALYLLLNDGQVLRWLGTAHQWDQIGNDRRIAVISV